MDLFDEEEKKARKRPYVRRVSKWKKRWILMAFLAPALIVSSASVVHQTKLLANMFNIVNAVLLGVAFEVIAISLIILYARMNTWYTKLICRILILMLVIQLSFANIYEAWSRIPDGLVTSISNLTNMAFLATKQLVSFASGAMITIMSLFFIELYALDRQAEERRKSK